MGGSGPPRPKTGGGSQAVWYHTIKKLLRQPPFQIFPPFLDYFSYYRRKSCIFSLSILSVFDVTMKNSVRTATGPPYFPAVLFPFFRLFLQVLLPFLQKPAAGIELYIKYFIKIFYEELSTLSTGFSTCDFPVNSDSIRWFLKEVPLFSGFSTEIFSGYCLHKF